MAGVRDRLQALRLRAVDRLSARLNRVALYRDLRRGVPGVAQLIDAVRSAALGGMRLRPVDPQHRFCFRCDLDVPCLNACCTDMQLPLTPYDVLRLRRCLALDSETFLAHHATVDTLPGLGLPLVRLRMDRGQGGRCAFASARGCAVYHDRPGVCRAYPVGRSAYIDERGHTRERHLLHRDTCCRGFSASDGWTVERYLADQGLVPYLAPADRYSTLLSRLSASGLALGEQQREAALVALYRLDLFGEWMEERRLLLRMRVKTARRRELREDEEARLGFAYEWLESLLLNPLSRRG
jgi:hypothetical protein